METETEAQYSDSKLTLNWGKFKTSITLVLLAIELELGSSR